MIDPAQQPTGRLQRIRTRLQGPGYPVDPQAVAEAIVRRVVVRASARSPRADAHHFGRQAEGQPDQRSQGQSS